MKSKHLLLTLLLALLVPWAAQAQETLTVHDGTGTNNYVPIYGYYADAYLKCQMVYPASELEDMTGGTLSALKFYTSQTSVTNLNGTFQVWIKEIDETTLSAFVDTDDATMVFEGTVAVSDGEMSIEFDDDYTYEGNNLLVGVYQTETSSSYPTTTFYGESVTSAAWQGYSYSSLEAITGQSRSFLPKTTFTYDPAAGDCPNPKTLVASDVTAHTAVMTWTMDDAAFEGEFNLEYKKTTEEEWTRIGLGNVRTYTLTGLDAETEYNVRIQTVCDPENDKWKNGSNFTTEVACPAPTNLAVTDGSLAAREATVAWEGTSESYVVMIGEVETQMVTTDFEDQAIPAFFTNSAAYPWTVTAGGANESGYCVIPGNHNVNSSTSDLTAEVVGPCTVSFMAKVSSENNWDWGRFFIDGTQQMQISGTQDWTSYSYELTEGTHTLVWRYYKDGSGSSGNDLFYVDDITMPVPTVSSWTEYTTNDLTYTFENLTPETPYQVKVKGNCGDEGYSAEAGPVSFTTLESCIKPTNLAASNVTNHSATLTWTGAEGQNDWEIKYNAGADFDPMTEGTLVEEEFGITNPYTFSQNLEANTTYYMYMRANCGEGDYSKWVGVSFTTGIANPAPTGGQISQVTPASAVVAWTAPAGDFLESYDVFYRMNLDGAPTDEETPQYTGVPGTSCVMYYEHNEDDSWCYVYVRANHGEDDGLSAWTYVGNFAVPENCAKPTGLTAYDPTPTSITLNWTEGADWQYMWEIAYSTVEGFDPDTLDPETYVEVSGYQPIPFTVTGLDPETTYYFRVRGKCTGDYGYSDWNSTTDNAHATTMISCPVPTDLAVTTASNTATLIWTGYSDEYTVQYRPAAHYDVEQGFEDGLGDWTFTSMNTANNIESGNAGCLGVAAHSGSYGFRFSSYSQITSDESFDQYMVSPELNIEGGNLSFYFKKHNSSTETLYVGVSTTTNDLDAFTWSENLAPTTTWQEYTQELSAEVKYVAFHYFGNYSYYVYVDDITIGEFNEPEWIDAGTATDETMTLTLDYGTKYDAHVKANCGEDYSDYITFTTKALKVFTTEGDWNVASNWTPAEVPSINDDVTIEAAATITAGVVAEANIITVAETGSVTIQDGGQLVANSNVSNVTVEKSIVGYGEANYETNLGYYLIANPTTTSLYPSEVEGLINETEEHYDLYDWSQSSELEWQNAKGDDYFTLSGYNHYGYLYANMDDNTLKFTGTVRGSQNRKSSSVYYNAPTGTTEFADWNLLGNPFVCNAYLVDNAGAALPYYKMNQTGDGFETVTGDAITPATGIFYQATANGSVYFTREAPARSANLNVMVSNGRSVKDNAIIRFGEGQEMGKFSFREGSTKVSFPMEGKEYSVVNAANEGEMPVSFKAEKNGTYTLSFAAEEVSFGYLHLIDNMTGADVNLIETPAYTFEAKTTDYANRFRLVFATGNNSNEESFAFFSNGNLVINNEGNATLQVVDVMGRIVKSESINGSASVNVNAAAGVYMLRLISGDNVKVQKVVVK